MANQLKAKVDELSKGKAKQSKATQRIEIVIF
jgi:hypothetical protein